MLVYNNEKLSTCQQYLTKKKILKLCEILIRNGSHMIYQLLFWGMSSKVFNYGLLPVCSSHSSNRKCSVFRVH